MLKKIEKKSIIMEITSFNKMLFAFGRFLM